MKLDSHRRRNRLSAVGGISVLALCGALVSACSSSSSGGSPSSGDSTAPSGASSEAIQQAQAAVDAVTAMPEFKSEGTAIDTSSLKGKQIVIIRGNGAVPFVVDVTNAEKAAAEADGMKTLTIDGHGQASQWSSAISQAIGLHAAGIIATGISPPLIKVALGKAAAAHIPVVDTLDQQSGTELLPGLTGNVGTDFKGAGKIMADYVIANSGGKPTHILILGDNEFTSEVQEVAGMRAEFEALAPADKVIFQDTVVANLATQIPQLVQTELRRDPAIEWVIGSYDAQAQYAVPAIVSAGAGDKVKVLSNNGVAANLKWVKTGHVQVFDVSPPAIWGGWAGFDNLARAMLGKDQVDEQIPMRAFVEDNLQGVDVSSQDALFGTSYKAAFLKLWGVS